MRAHGAHTCLISGGFTLFTEQVDGDYFGLLMVVPPAAATLAIAGNVSPAIGGAHPGALPGSLLAMVLIAVVAVWWHRTLAASAPPSSPAIAATGAGSPGAGA